jgi:hypothetical protein
MNAIPADLLYLDDMETQVDYERYKHRNLSDGAIAGLARKNWALTPYGYTYRINGAYGSHAWILNNDKIRLIVRKETKRYAGRLTIVVIDTAHNDTYTNPAKATPVHVSQRGIICVPGVPTWTATFHDHHSFITALQEADQHMHDPKALILTAALTPPAQTPQ